MKYENAKLVTLPNGHIAFDRPVIVYMMTDYLELLKSEEKQCQKKQS